MSAGQWSDTESRANWAEVVAREWGLGKGRERLPVHGGKGFWMGAPLWKCRNELISQNYHRTGLLLYRSECAWINCDLTATAQQCEGEGSRSPPRCLSHVVINCDLNLFLTCIWWILIASVITTEWRLIELFFCESVESNQH